MPVITEEKEIARRVRKHRNSLYIMGSGLMALGIWNVARVILVVINSPQTLIEPELAKNISGGATIIILLLVLAVFFGALLSVYLFVGRKAREEGLGKKQHSFYIAVIVLLALFHCFGVIYSGAALMGMVTVSNESVMSLAVSMIVDATAAVTLGEMCYSAVMIRVYGRKNIGEG